MGPVDGRFYAPPSGREETVCRRGEFRVGAAGLVHGHIYGMCEGLRDAGAEIAWAWDPDPALVARFREAFPEAAAADGLDRILGDPSVKMVATAHVPSERGPLGVRAMGAGKHVFADKAPFTTTGQLEEARRVTAETGLVWAVCYGERLQNRAAVLAGSLIARGSIGDVVQVLGVGPHRLNAASRPAYFFEKEKYGGILCDIGSHQIEQFLHFTGAKDARVAYSAIANYAHPGHPGLDDFGEASLVTDAGQSGYFRLDWFTPDGLRSWGDGRTLVLGTEGYIELRKYVDIAGREGGDHLFLVDSGGERYVDAAREVPYFPYFGDLIRDCLDGTENAMTQEHAFKAAELSLIAQQRAVRLR